MPGLRNRIGATAYRTVIDAEHSGLCFQRFSCGFPLGRRCALAEAGSPRSRDGPPVAAMTNYSRPQPPSSLLLRALFVGGLFLTVLGIGSQAAPPAGQGHGHGHGRTLLAAPTDGQSDLLPL